MTAEVIRDGQITVELSHPGKVLFPDDGVTKGDLVAFYLAVAGRMLPLQTIPGRNARNESRSIIRRPRMSRGRGLALWIGSDCVNCRSR